MPTLLRIIAFLVLCFSCALAQEGQNKIDQEKDLPEKNPFESPEDVLIGRQYFLGHCAQCHGPEGEGGRGVNLTTGQYRHGGTDRQLFMTIRRGVPGSEMHGSRLSQPELWRVVAYVRRLGSAGALENATGDVEAGKRIYEGKGGCGACHSVNGKGGIAGPDLSEIGLRRSLKFLAASIVAPSADINPEYRSATVVTRDGRRVKGVILNEDDYSIQLRDQGEDLRSFLKRDLKEVRKETESLMPSYKAMLSDVEVNDLVSYLHSLRGTE